MTVGHDGCLFSVSGIPEDPCIAEEYYADTFDSCSEESEEEEEETVFSGLEEGVEDEGSRSDYRASQQVPGGTVRGTDWAVASQRESRKFYNLEWGREN